MKKMKCPCCGGKLNIDEDNIDTCTCEYCKSTILIEGLSDESYKSKTNIKKMKHEEIMYDKKTNYDKEITKQKHEYKKEEQKRNIKINIITAVSITLGIILLIAVPSFIAKTASNKQEKELENIVEEVMVLVEENEFDKAYLKAKTIKYTENWSSEIEEKWEETRKELIDYIVEKEKEVNGKSTHKKEKSSLFDIFD